MFKLFKKRDNCPIPKKVRADFDKWIARNFYGLSAHTLYQVMCDIYGNSATMADHIVYVELYHVYINGCDPYMKVPEIQGVIKFNSKYAHIVNA